MALLHLALAQAILGDFEARELAVGAGIDHSRIPDTGVPKGGKLIDLPCRLYWNLGGAVVPAPPETSHVGAVGDCDLDGKAVRPISSPTPCEGQTHVEWLVDLPLDASRLDVTAMCRQGAHGRRRFEVWINGLRRWYATVGMPREHDRRIPVTVDLTRQAGKPALVTLVVDAMGSNGSDWANWIEPRIVRETNAQSQR